MGGPIFDSMLQILEVLMVVLVGFYSILAFVIIRQVQLMNTTFKTSWGVIFIFLAALHFFASLALVLVSISLVFF